MITRIIKMCLGAACISFGAALTIKADIGISPIDAFNMTLSSITLIKVGTIGAIVNSTFILFQWFVLKKNFEFRRLAQVIFAVLVGAMINFFYYRFFSIFDINAYIFRLILFILALAIIAFGCALTIHANVISSPIETFAEVLAKDMNKPTGKCRQAIDFFALGATLLCFFIFKTPLYLREGTILSTIIFGPIFGYAMKVLAKGEN